VCLNTTPSLKKQTLRDNLGLYATFKRVARNQIKKRVDNMIFNLELELIQKQLASTHSDVQKRKTSTRIAFICDRKVIMLDELTIDFKTTTLCKFWQMLKNKQGR
jgi:ABC-type multidrug transport system ATPase subunit